MIPALVDPAKSPPGEVVVFELLCDSAPADWIVLHSLDLPAHVRQVEGELDFLVMIPGVAVVCLEVKSHERISRGADGLWRMGNESPTHRSPFRQASEQMHSVRKRLSKVATVGGVPFVSAVAFPRCQFNVPPTEWEPWQVLDETTLRTTGLTESLLNLGHRFRAKLASTPTARWFQPTSEQPTIGECERILAELRPVFERARSPKARRAEALGEIRRYTDEQLEALDDLEANPRVVFNGGAGTGKTFLAIEAARRGVMRGDRTLLCCYNRLLATWLKSETKPLMPGLTTDTLHALMYRIAGQEPVGAPTSEYFAETLPVLAVDALLDGHEMAGAFDMVVIDEAQDIATPRFLDVIELLVTGGLVQGRVMAFGDFAHQAIYTGSDNGQLLRGRMPSSQFELRTNCRNRPRIGALAGSAFGVTPYRRFRRPDDGIHVTLRPYADQAQHVALIAEAIDTMRGDGHQLGDIAVLSMAARGAAIDLLEPHARWLTSAENATPGRIRTATVHAFKGLEAPAVVVTDLVDLSNDRQRQLFYIAASRATDRLTVLVAQDAVPVLTELIMGAESHG